MGGRGRRETEFRGRPKSDANYGPKKRFNNDRQHEGGNRYNDRGPKEVQLFKATCTTCGKPCEVPFRPDGQKPVLCRDCFSSKNSSPTSNERFGKPNRDNNAPRYENRSETFRQPAASTQTGTDHADMLRKISSLENKVSEILTLLKQAKEEKTQPEVVNETRPVAKKEKAEVKVVKPKKVATKPAKKVAKKK